MALPRPRLSGAFAFLAFALGACGTDRPDTWTDASHGKNAPPAYDVVFPKGKVQRLDIVITPEDWTTMQDDMTSMLGEFGAGGDFGGGGGMGGQPDGGMGGGGGGFPAEFESECVGKASGDACTATFNGTPFTSTCSTSPMGGALACLPPMGGGGGGFPGGPPDGGGLPGGGGGGDLIPNTPVYVPATVKFEGKAWNHVGLRYKGNSSLSQAWRSGVGKMPLRFNFDKFEDEYPEIEGQHFYGFGKLSLSNAVSDASLIRNKVATDLFREAGVPASYTAFAAVYVDHGDGPQYWGLYTLAEDPGDPLLERFFSDDSGPLYEADGVGARLQSFDEASFEPDNKAAEAAGWGSVEALITALNSERTDSAAWRSRLEATLDVDGFLKWLAYNTVIENWDAYGAMAHNYLLYSHPGENGRLHWVTWDHDRSFQDGMRATSLSQESVDATWPLIRYLMDDPVYRPIYEKYALEAADGLLAPGPLEARFREEHALVTPWAVGENAEQAGFTFLSSPQAFQDALTGANGLVDFATKRQAEVHAAFGTSP
ncbi:CotH kinase family protein [Corallococcus sp. AS-1-12]|uniref:CotH kinase family protein n=1 Tax=Corallococcus sp. AS-1-12 TaxID=2874598 RepID=UPI001CBC6C0B|nr:CotH kinase family protein [Corallococcus sp. AS-1-12]MBZ4330100.1 CotH kinase family protein [Corallococcus sp. AS-1-12]